MILKIASNPEVVRAGDIVIYVLQNRGKRVLQVGKVERGYNDPDKGGYGEYKSYTVRNLKTGELHYPYTQDTILVNNGIEVFGVEAKLVETKLGH